MVLVLHDMKLDPFCSEFYGPSLKEKERMPHCTHWRNLSDGRGEKCIVNYRSGQKVCLEIYKWQLFTTSEMDVQLQNCSQLGALLDILSDLLSGSL